MDYFIPLILNIAAWTLFKVVSIFILMVVTVPYMIVTGLIMMIAAYLIRRRWIIAQNDSQRIESITKAPVNTKLGSVSDGMDTIRAFRKQDFFIK